MASTPSPGAQIPQPRTTRAAATMPWLGHRCLQERSKKKGKKEEKKTYRERKKKDQKDERKEKEKIEQVNEEHQPSSESGNDNNQVRPSASNIRNGVSYDTMEP